MSKLGPISCLCVGDVMNQQKNILVIVTADGWCYLYSTGENIFDMNLLSATVSNKSEFEQVWNIWNNNINNALY